MGIKPNFRIGIAKGHCEWTLKDAADVWTTLFVSTTSTIVNTKIMKIMLLPSQYEQTIKTSSKKDGWFHLKEKMYLNLIVSAQNNTFPSNDVLTLIQQKA